MIVYVDRTLRLEIHAGDTVATVLQRLGRNTLGLSKDERTALVAYWLTLGERCHTKKQWNGDWLTDEKGLRLNRPYLTTSKRKR